VPGARERERLGAIFVYRADAVIANTTVSGNRATEGGGVSENVLL
jgi:hypothetical protein